MTWRLLIGVVVGTKRLGKCNNSRVMVSTFSIFFSHWVNSYSIVGVLSWDQITPGTKNITNSWTRQWWNHRQAASFSCLRTKISSFLPHNHENIPQLGSLCAMKKFQWQALRLVLNLPNTQDESHFRTGKLIINLCGYERTSKACEVMKLAARCGKGSMGAMPNGEV